MDRDLLKLLARLTALKGNLPRHPVPRKYADEFNSLLTDLEKSSGESLGEFKIPPSEIRPRMTSSNYLTGQKTYSSENYCDRDYLLMKVDGVLGYFTLILRPVGEEQKPDLGFHVEEKE